MERKKLTQDRSIFAGHVMGRKKNPKLNKPLFEALCKVIGKSPEEVAEEIGLFAAGSRGGSIFKHNSDESRNRASFIRAYENGTFSDENMVKTAEYFARYGIKPKDRPLWVEDFILDYDPFRAAMDKTLKTAVDKAEKTYTENKKLEEAWDTVISSLWSDYGVFSDPVKEIIRKDAKEALHENMQALVKERSELWRLVDPEPAPEE